MAFKMLIQLQETDMMEEEDQQENVELLVESL